MHSAAMHYSVDPHAGAPGLALGNIYGGEACMWTEYVSPETLDTRIWPRTAAIAERFWSPMTVTEVRSMYRRLETVSRDLELVGLTHRSAYRPMLERIAGGPDVAALQTLADVVEPVKVYKRGTLGDYTSFTPLNRLVDAARPESDTAREFGWLVDRYIESKSAQDGEAIRQWLLRWRGVHPQLERQRGRTHLLDEALGAAEALSATAEVGLAALAGESLPAYAEKLKGLSEPRASVLVVVVPHIRKLLPAAAQ